MQVRLLSPAPSLKTFLTTVALVPILDGYGSYMDTYPTTEERVDSMRTFAKAALAVFLGASLLVVSTGAVFGHNIVSIKGTVDCQGNYSITPRGDVYDLVRMVVVAVLTLLIAWLSFTFYESRFLRLKDRLAPHRS